MPNPVRKMMVSLKNDGSTVVHQMDRLDFVIGRSQESDFPFVNDEVSRKHLRVFVRQDEIYLRDLGSKNGTFVNGKRLPENQDYLYIEGNPITLGRSRAIFKVSAERVAQPSPATPAEEEPVYLGEKTEKLNFSSVETPSAEEISNPHVNPQKSVGMIYDFDDSLEIENSGLSEVLGQEQKPKEFEVPKPTDVPQRTQLDKSRTQIPSELPSQVRAENTLPKNFNRVVQRPDAIRINPKNKAGGYKSPSELVVEVAREVAHVIDKQFINIPEDKKAKRKGEKILKEIFKLASELKEKAYDTHDKIIKKAVDQANALVESAERDREKILESGRQKILSLEQRKLQEVEVEVARALEDAKIRVDALESSTAESVLKAKSEAADELARAKAKATLLVSDAERQAQELLHRAESAKTALEDLVAREDRKRQDLAIEIQSLEDQSERAQAEIKLIQRQKEQAMLELEKQQGLLEDEKERIQRQIESAESGVKTRWSQVQVEEQKMADLLQTLQLKREAEEQLFKKRQQDLQLQLVEAKKQLEDQYRKQKAEIDKKIEIENSTFQSLSKELKISYEKYKSEIDDQVKNENERWKAISSEIDARIKRAHAEAELAQRKLEAIQSELQSRTLENQELLHRLDQAEVEHRRLSEESLELSKNSNQMIVEIESLRSRKEKMERAIDELDTVKQTEMANLAKLKAEALGNIQFERTQAEKERQRLLQETEQKVHDQIAKAQMQAEEIVSLAQQNYDAVEREIKKNKSEASSYVQNLHAQVEKWKKEQEDEVDRLKAQTELEIQKRHKEARGQLEIDLADVRLKREMEAEQLLKNKQSEFERQVRERAEHIARIMDQKLIARIRPHIKSQEAPGVIDEISLDLQKTIIQLLDPAKQYADEDLKKVIGIQAKELARDSHFWKKASVAVGVLVTLVLLPSAWREFKTQTQELASEQKTRANEEYAQKLEEKERNKPKFEPEMTTEFLPTYTDRVLYLEQYVARELDKTYREDWILKLNEFFVNDLKLSENVIVTFIAKESNLLKELQAMRDGINPSFVDENRARMMELENVFVDEVRRVLKTESNFKKFEKFKRDFYSQSHQ